MKAYLKYVFVIIILTIIIGTGYYRYVTFVALTDQEVVSLMISTNRLPAKQPTDYEKQLATALNEFAEAFRQGDAAVRQASAVSVRDRILSLTVPVQYKDLHLGLVLAFSDMVKGQIIAGQNKFAAAILPYSWLKAVSLSGQN